MKTRETPRRWRVATAILGVLFIALLVTVVVTNVMLLAQGHWLMLISFPLAGLALFMGGKMLYDMYGIVRYGDILWNHPKYGIKAQEKMQLEKQKVVQFSTTGTLSTPTMPIEETHESPPPPIEDLGTAIEPIIGYREWVVGYSPRIGEYRLRSFWEQDLWKPKQAHQALCLRGRSNPFVAFREEGSLSDHDAPHINCTCGIYARESLEQLGLEGGVYGSVYLWGEVIVCERGYRAEYAYPKDLIIQGYAPKASERAKREIEEAYGIPVTVIVGIEDL